MTTHTPAPAPQDFVATELRGIIDVCGESPTATVSVERMRLWLSKLRAPVADERAAFEAWNVKTNQGYDLTPMKSGKLATYESDLTEHAWRGFCHAVLASAPVAGEVAYWLVYQDWDLKAVRFAPGAEGKPVLLPGYSAMPLYAAPQASEAVQRAGYAGVTVWVGDRQATQILTQQGLELSNKDELLERFEVARAALSAQPGAQKYWLCCGSKDPNHSNRRAPDCFNAAKAKWGTADQHSAAQKKEQ